MGGYNSGRHGGRPTTDAGLTLWLDKLLKDRLFRPGQNLTGFIVWTNTRTGERVGSIGYQAHLGDEGGRVRLEYTTTRWDGEKQASDYWIELTTTPQPFGGRRWWFPSALAHGSGSASFICRPEPQPLPQDKRTGSATTPNAPRPLTARSTGLLNCGVDWEQRAALATTFQNPKACAGRPSIER